MVYDKHIFVCINQRVDTSMRKSCGEAHGMEIVSALKEKLKSRSLPLKIRAQKAGCLDICDFGQTLVIYPQGIFYVGVELEDIDEIIEESIANDRVIQRLLLDNVKKGLSK